ncbi:hypothetical protein D9M69_713400 [compost metagenome]
MVSDYTARIQPVSDFAFASALLDEEPIDPLNGLHFLLGPGHQDDAVSLDALVLPLT